MQGGPRPLCQRDMKQVFSRRFTRSSKVLAAMLAPAGKRMCPTTPATATLIHLQLQSDLRNISLPTHTQKSKQFNPVLQHGVCTATSHMSRHVSPCRNPLSRHARCKYKLLDRRHGCTTATSCKDSLVRFHEQRFYFDLHAKLSRHHCTMFFFSGGGPQIKISPSRKGVSDTWRCTPHARHCNTLLHARGVLLALRHIALVLNIVSWQLVKRRSTLVVVATAALSTCSV